MDNSQLLEDLLDFNLEDLLNLTFDLDSLNSIDKISTQWLDELTSSINIENNELSTRNITFQKNPTPDEYTETVGETNEQNAQYTDLVKNHSLKQPSNDLEIVILDDADQDDPPFSPPIVDLKTEDIVSESFWIQNNDLITKSTEPRISLSKEELFALEREFQICHYPDRFTRKRLALSLNLTQLTVSEWFTSRRIKMRKQSLDNENFEENGEPYRMNISKKQIAMLEREFEKSQYPDCLTRQKLSLMLGLRDATVKNWFHYRRVRMRKLMEHIQSMSMYTKSNTLSTSEICIQEDLDEKIDINNNQLITVEHMLEKQNSHCDTVCKSTSSFSLTNQQIQELQTETSSLSTLTESNQSSEQKWPHALPPLVQQSTDQQLQEPKTETSSLSTLTESNQGSEQKWPHALPPLVQQSTDQQLQEPQTETSSLSTLTESNQGSEQKWPHALSALVQQSTNQQLQEPQTETFSLSSLAKLNQGPNKKTPEKIIAFVQPQTDTSVKIENSLSLSSASTYRKRKRTNFCKSQLSVLEQQFIKCKYPNFDTICQLASTIKVADDKVRIWFKNRRSKQRDLDKKDRIMQQQTEITDPTQPNSRSMQKCKKTNSRKNRFSALELNFKKCQYPDLAKLCQLALKTNFTNSQVRRWFTYRRAKERLLKKRSKKIAQVQTEMPNISSISTGSFKQNYRPKGTTLNANQLALLEHEFSICHYPEIRTREKLASAINLTFSQVTKWFENRRQKERKLWGYSQSSTTSTETSNLLSLAEDHASNLIMQENDFNENQLVMLENEFKKSQYPDCGTCIHLASIVNVPCTRINEWFRNRRAKERMSETLLLTGTCRPQYCAQKIQFNKSQLAVLEHQFAQCQYLDYDTTCSLSALINVSYERVRTWFTNRRAKQRKLNKHSQLVQLQSKTSNFLLLSEPHSMKTETHGRQMEQFQNNQQSPMIRTDYCNNTLYNQAQHMRVFPQNFQFGWYNSVTPAYISESCSLSAVPLIQEDGFYVNPEPPSAQYVYSHTYDAPAPNHSFLAEL